MLSKFPFLRRERRLVQQPTPQRRNPLTLERLEDRCLLATFLVTNTAASGPGSLATAIGAAATGDTILFNGTLSGQTITVNTPLTIATGVTISRSGRQQPHHQRRPNPARSSTSLRPAKSAFPA